MNHVNTNHSSLEQTHAQFSSVAAGEESWSRTPEVSGLEMACNNAKLYAFKDNIKHLDEAQRQSEAGEVSDCAARSVTFLQTCQQHACVCAWVARRVMR